MKLRRYISLLLLTLLLFPIAEAAQHELRHLSEDHCDVRGLHFCETQHHCDICDYIFSSSATPPDSQRHPVVFSSGDAIYTSLLVSEGLAYSVFNLGPRGPPVTALFQL